MIMPKEKREIQKSDIMPLDAYIKDRKELRKNIVNFKKNRRVALGPYATFYFESFETMLAQFEGQVGTILATFFEKMGESTSSLATARPRYFFFELLAPTHGPIWARCWTVFAPTWYRL